MRHTFLLAAIALAAHTASLWASDLAAAARIRWVTSGSPSAPTVGYAVTILNDTLVARGEHDSADTALPLRSLASLELSRGRHNQSARYALVGACAGALTGAGAVWIVGAVVDETIHQFGVRSENRSKLSDYAPAMLVGAGVGAGVGAALGAYRLGPERWEIVPLAGGRFGAVIETGPELRVGLTARF